METIQKNEKGEILCDPRDISEVADDFYQYHGGWAKTVTGIDKTKTNGYSLQGSFLNGPEWIPVGGLVLGCSWQGSYKHPKNVTRYFLCQMQEDGTLKRLDRIIDPKSWATDLWPAIEKVLMSPAPTPAVPATSETAVNSLIEGFTDAEILAEVKRRGLSL